MKFLVDAQLPQRLVRELVSAGHDVIHTSELELANRTPDKEIIARAVSGGFVVITKDNDFVNSFVLRRLPPKLLLVSTGNCSNDLLLSLFRKHLPAIEAALQQFDFIEITATSLVIHV